MSATLELYRDVLTAADHPRIGPAALAIATDPRRFGVTFYAQLFARAPALRRLFPEDMTQQEVKIAQTLCIVVRALEASEDLPAMLRELGARHRGYGVKPAHYRIVGEAMLAALRELVGPSFDAEQHAAWSRLFAYVARHMQSGA